jgi:hypothetical protein
LPQLLIGVDELTIELPGIDAGGWRFAIGLNVIEPLGRIFAISIEQ